MVWSDRELKAWAGKGNVWPYNPFNVNPASIDLCLGNRIRVAKWYWRNPLTRLLAWELRHWRKLEYWSAERTFDAFTLWPGQFVLCHSMEHTILPDQAIGLLFSKSSTGRTGLEHLHAGYGDNGFNGQWTWELHNVAPWPIELLAGKRLMQVVLVETKSVPEKLYGEVGHYQYQLGAQPAHKEF